MPRSRVFEGVSQHVFDAMKAMSAKEHGTVYEPADAPVGVATTRTVVGVVRLEFKFDAQEKRITYTIKDIPLLVPESQIWAGIANSIGACGGDVQ